MKIQANPIVEKQTASNKVISTISYLKTDVVNLRLPRKRVVATFDLDIDRTALPKRKPYVQEKNYDKPIP